MIGFPLKKNLELGPVAQRLEQTAHNCQVSGSIPLRPILFEENRLHEFQFPLEFLAKYAPLEIDLRGYSYSVKTTNFIPEFFTKTAADPPYFYHDTTNYLVLARKKVPLVCLGFEYTPIFMKGTGIVVCQMQGRRGMLVQGIRWEKLLLHTLMEWGFRVEHLNKIRVMTSTSNRWFPKPFVPSEGMPKPSFQNKEMEENNARRRKTMHMRYDVTPRRMGFRQIRGTANGNDTSKNQPYHYSQILREEYLSKFPLAAV